NKISSYPEFLTPTLVASNVLRIDLGALGWFDEKGEPGRQVAVLERFAENKIDVYFHATKTWNVDGEKYDTFWPGGKSDVDGKFYPRGRYQITSKKGESYQAPSPLLPEKQIDELREWLYSEVPILNGEQFYLYVARQQSIFNEDSGVGYYEWFGPNG